MQLLSNITKTQMELWEDTGRVKNKLAATPLPPPNQPKYLSGRILPWRQVSDSLLPIKLQQFPEPQWLKHVQRVPQYNDYIIYKAFLNHNEYNICNILPNNNEYNI